jgi:hypothetical protein
VEEILNAGSGHGRAPPAASSAATSSSASAPTHAAPMMAGKTKLNTINITSTAADTGKGNDTLAFPKNSGRNVRSRHRGGNKATNGGPPNNSSTSHDSTTSAIRVVPVSLTQSGTKAGTLAGSDIGVVSRGAVGIQEEGDGGVVDYFVLEGSDLSMIAGTGPWDESSSRGQ